MSKPHVCRVDLRDPEVLDRVVKEHLRFSACPVDGQPFPGMLQIVTLVMDLPDASQRTCEAQVVLRLEDERFIVQLMEKLDVPQLSFLGRLATRAGRRGASGEVPKPSGSADAPFEGTPVATRRERHFPKPDAGQVLRAREAATERAAQPPPRIGAAGRLKCT
jgi:hypothetical protein